ncbi:unnamed protein product [Effrenium voratum]|nr:unnamed protein product [Effrenium voratum]
MFVTALWILFFTSVRGIWLRRQGVVQRSLSLQRSKSMRSAKASERAGSRDLLCALLLGASLVWRLRAFAALGDSENDSGVAKGAFWGLVLTGIGLLPLAECKELMLSKALADASTSSNLAFGVLGCWLLPAQLWALQSFGLERYLLLAGCATLCFQEAAEIERHSMQMMGIALALAGLVVGFWSLELRVAQLAGLGLAALSAALCRASLRLEATQLACCNLGGAVLLLPFLALDGGLALGAPPAASAALGALLALWALLGKRSLEALVQRLGAVTCFSALLLGQLCVLLSEAQRPTLGFGLALGALLLSHKAQQMPEAEAMDCAECA